MPEPVTFDSLSEALIRRETELREQEIAIRRKLIDAEIERVVLTHEKLLDQPAWECAKLPLPRRVDIVLGIYSLIRGELRDQLDVAQKLLYEIWYTREIPDHDEGCPADDTCSCAAIARYKKALKGMKS